MAGLDELLNVAPAWGISQAGLPPELSLWLITVCVLSLAVVVVVVVVGLLLLLLVVVVVVVLSTLSLSSLCLQHYW